MSDSETETDTGLHEDDRDSHSDDDGRPTAVPDLEDGSETESDTDSDHNNESRVSKENGRQHGMPTRWGFLWQWFKTLKGCVHVVEPTRFDTHDVRLGRGPADWRIEMTILKDGETVEQQAQRLGAIREALVLTSVLAEVDYDTWLSQLTRTSGFKPTNFVDLASYKLQRKYTVPVHAGTIPGAYEWEFMEPLFGVRDYSAQFTSHLAAIAKVAAKQGINVYAMAPLSLTFHVRYTKGHAPSLSDQPFFLCDLHALVDEMIEIEAAHRQEQSTRAASFRGAPVFRVDAIDVNLRKFDAHSSVLEALQPVLALGVSISSLTLPAYVDEDNVKDRVKEVAKDKFFSAWVPLVRAILGQDAQPSPVGRVTLPEWYCQEPYLAAFCSGLEAARGLRFLRLESNPKRFDQPASNELLWSWLGYALFHPLSSSSVESLSLKGFLLQEEELNALEAALDTKSDSLGCVWRRKSKMLGPSGAPPARRRVVVRSNTTLERKDGHPRGREFVTRQSIAAIVMTEQAESASSEPVDVLVLGFGFCQVDPSSFENTQDDASQPSCSASRRGVHTLLFHEDEEEEKELVPADHMARLFALVGRALASVSIETEGLDADSLTTCLRKCPRLQNLRLARMSLDSLTPLVRFHTDGRRLASLELRGVDIPTAPVDTFPHSRRG